MKRILCSLASPGFKILIVKVRRQPYRSMYQEGGRTIRVLSTGSPFGRSNIAQITSNVGQSKRQSHFLKAPSGTYKKTQSPQNIRDQSSPPCTSTLTFQKLLRTPVFFPPSTRISIWCGSRPSPVICLLEVVTRTSPPVALPTAQAAFISRKIKRSVSDDCAENRHGKMPIPNLECTRLHITGL